MERLCISWWLVAMLSATTWFWTVPALAAKQAEKARAAEKIVTEVLQREAEEGIADRAAAMRPAIELIPTHREALWHSGFVYDTLTNQWLRFNELPEYCGKDNRLATYRKLRDEAPQTIEGELELARWCKKYNLDSQARAHLTQILEQNPDHAEAHRELGDQLINGTWISAAEIAEAEARSRQITDDLKEWKPRLEKLREDLTRARRTRREAAQTALAEIRDPRAVAAIEVVFCSAGEELAVQGVELLEHIRCKEAAATLAWHAVFSPWERVRDAAAKALGFQAKHDYVPLLLGAMQAPIQSKVQIDGSMPHGLLLYRHVFYREGLDQRNLAVFDESYQHMFATRNEGRHARTGVTISAIVGSRADPTRLNTQDLQARVDAWKVAHFRAAIEAAEREKAVEQYNLIASEMNSRIFSALSQATGQTTPTTPEAWQKWWYYDNEAESAGEIPLRYSYHHQRHAGVSIATGPVQSFHSCLAAGTLVWTEAGAVPVEKVRVGDRVLACDPNTGALELKPVLRTTFNANAPTIKLQIGSEMIETTGGHVFWASGKGWVKARDLQEAMQVHTLHGTVEVKRLEPGEEQSMFNLVVADFHTYFAGKERILTHDVTIRKPTNCIVPGLDAVRPEVAISDVPTR